MLVISDHIYGKVLNRKAVFLWAGMKLHSHVQTHVQILKRHAIDRAHE